jgi:hypothetical protein
MSATILIMRRSLIEPAGDRQTENLLSVVIPTWNAVDLVLEAVEHLQQFVMPQWAELIVVNDGSTDETSVRLRQQFPNVVVIEQKSNQGFGAAVNAGFRVAQGRYLATVNNDTLVSWSTLYALVSVLEKQSMVAAVSPRILNSMGEQEKAVFDFPRPLWSLLPRWFYKSLSRNEDLICSSTDSVQSDYLRGACIVFRRNSLEEVGLFDEQFFMFAEEIDLFRRLNNAGWVSKVVQQAVAEHKGGTSSRAHQDREISSRFRQISYRSMCCYYSKHHIWLVALIMRAMLALKVLGRLALAVFGSLWSGADSWWVAEHARCLKTVMQPVTSRPVEPRL